MTEPDKDALIRELAEALDKLLRRDYGRTCQHDETGRFWSGPRCNLPPRYAECPPQPGDAALTSAKEEAK